MLLHNHGVFPAGEITTEGGVLHHKSSGKKSGYGEMYDGADDG
jgi:hypothetical protein